MRVAWAPWRMSYIRGERASGCIFCVGESAGERELVLAASASTVVMRNKCPYNNGHLLIAPRQHVRSLADLSTQHYAALMDAVLAGIGIVERVLGPDGLNVGINLGAAAGAGIADHVHWHIVPRWSGDTNYMPVLADVKVLPEHLTESAARLRPHFESWLAGRP